MVIALYYGVVKLSIKPKTKYICLSHMSQIQKYMEYTNMYKIIWKSIALSAVK